VIKALPLWQICGVINECAGQIARAGNSAGLRAALSSGRQHPNRENA
jgi:hypothetical protein